jgi:hypothetical protein
MRTFAPLRLRTKIVQFRVRDHAIEHRSCRVVLVGVVLERTDRERVERFERHSPEVATGERNCLGADAQQWHVGKQDDVAGLAGDHGLLLAGPKPIPRAMLGVRAVQCNG